MEIGLTTKIILLSFNSWDICEICITFIAFICGSFIVYIQKKKEFRVTPSPLSWASKRTLYKYRVNNFFLWFWTYFSFLYLRYFFFHMEFRDNIISFNRFLKYLRRRNFGEKKIRWNWRAFNLVNGEYSLNFVENSSIIFRKCLSGTACLKNL